MKLNDSSKQHRFFTLKVSEKGKVVEKDSTHSFNRFSKKLRTINLLKPHRSVYLKVSYGKQKDNHEKLVNFYNDGSYDNKYELWQAFNAFTER